MFSVPFYFRWNTVSTKYNACLVTALRLINTCTNHNSFRNRWSERVVFSLVVSGNGECILMLDPKMQVFTVEFIHALLAE